MCRVVACSGASFKIISTLPALAVLPATREQHRGISMRGVHALGAHRNLRLPHPLAPLVTEKNPQTMLCGGLVQRHVRGACTLRRLAQALAGLLEPALRVGDRGRDQRRKDADPRRAFAPEA